MQQNTIRLFWRASRRYPLATAISLINPMLTVVVGSFIGPYIVAIFFNHLQSGSVSLTNSWPLIAYYGLTQLYGEVIGWRITLLSVWKTQTEVMRNLYAQIFEHLSLQSLGFHSDRFGGSLVSQTSKFVGAYDRFTSTLVFNVIPVITSILAATIILGLVFWQYALFLLAISLLFFITVLVSAKSISELNTLEAQASTKLTGRLADVITNISAVKSFGREADELKTYEGLANEWQQRSLDAMWGFLKVSTVYSALLMIMNTVALIAAIYAAQYHLVAAGTVYLCVTYTFTVARQVWEMNNIMRNYNRAMGDAHDMTQILAIQPAITDPSKTIPSKSLPKGGHISFKDVTFSHTTGSGHEALFKNFSLDIKPGEKIGLVGHSGSGKTTLTRLLLRFMDIDNGSIVIDGTAITDLPQAVLRNHIAYVPQEPLLFHRSLRENIAYGNPQATDQHIEDAAKKAHAFEFIKKLPDGFNTLVGERGVKLSGGQRQRVAIARAILKDAPILVLDEATSALDSESEKLIQAALNVAMQGRTTIVIAHRLSTIQKMDRIIVLDDGHIAEQGSHAQLLNDGGVYASLWRHQSGGFIEE